METVSKILIKMCPLSTDGAILILVSFYMVSVRNNPSYHDDQLRTSDPKQPVFSIKTNMWSVVFFILTIAYMKGPLSVLAIYIYLPKIHISNALQPDLPKVITYLLVLMN